MIKRGNSGKSFSEIGVVNIRSFGILLLCKENNPLNNSPLANLVKDQDPV